MITNYCHDLDGRDGTWSGIGFVSGRGGQDTLATRE